MNKKSLIFGIILGILSWFWDFIIVGFASFDYISYQPIINRDISVYITMLIINIIITMSIFTLYVWKYEKKKPINADKSVIDALILGAIICGMNFLFDALFFGMMGKNLIVFFWIETTTGYFYPSYILMIYIIAYAFYGRKSLKI